jgi:hypothetical protein
MTRTPSTRTVIATLRNAGFDLAAIVEQGRGEIEIGFISQESGRVEMSDRERTEQAATVAEELLGWGGYITGYGTWVLRADYRYDDCSRELALNNID